VTGINAKITCKTGIPKQKQKKYFKRYILIFLARKVGITTLNDGSPLSVMMKCFERLVILTHINIIPDTLHQLQFAYCPNRSTYGTISNALHTALSHLDKRGNNCERMLFIDNSSAFNTIVPSKLITKLETPGLNTSLCSWILDFLTQQPQLVRVGNINSATPTLNTGAPQRVCF
jgi:hypothetical protein